MDCLFRPKYSYELSNELSCFNYVYFFNANIIINNEVGDEILPDQSGLIGVEHPCFAHRNNNIFTYDRNPKSNAYIKNGDGDIYYQACLWGGTKDMFIKLSEVISSWVNEDIIKGIEPVWLDESYLNKYFLLNKPKTIPSTYAWPEYNKTKNNSEIKIIQLDKSKYISGNFKYLT